MSGITFIRYDSKAK